MTGVLLRREHTETRRQRGEGHSDEMAAGVMYLWAKEPHRLPGAPRLWKRQGRILSQSCQWGVISYGTLIKDSWPPNNISIVRGHLWRAPFMASLHRCHVSPLLHLETTRPSSQGRNTPESRRWLCLPGNLGLQCLGSAVEILPDALWEASAARPLQ